MNSFKEYRYYQNPTILTTRNCAALAVLLIVGCALCAYAGGAFEVDEKDESTYVPYERVAEPPAVEVAETSIDYYSLTLGEYILLTQGEGAYNSGNVVLNIYADH